MAAFAKLKNCGFDWTGDDYEKHKRSQGPDREGLKLHANHWACLLQLAPACYPRHTPLKEAVQKLQLVHNILGDKPLKIGWEDRAAGQWSLMMEHVWT